uniref:Uncharacterized protein n=1 Tax=viral metagenome TaxID=1070528 RepID=A0A6M3JCD3_9ZZZZ
MARLGISKGKIVDYDEHEKRWPYERYFDSERVDLRIKRNGRRKSWEVSKLWDIHQEVIRLKTLGMKNVQIQSALGVSKGLVTCTLNSRVAQDKLMIMRGARDAETIDLAKRIKEFAPKCLDLLESVVEGVGAGTGATLGLRVRTSQDYADRAGLGAVRKFQSESVHLTVADIEKIKQRASDSRNVIIVKSEEAVADESK